MNLTLRVTALLFVLVNVVMIAPPVSADYRDEIERQTEAFAGEQGAQLGQAKDPRLITAYVIRILLGLIGTLFLAYTVYAGYLIMTGGGNEDRINEGKSTLRTAVIGVLITLSAYAITLLVTRILTGDQQNRGDYLRVREEDQSQFFNRDPLNEDTTPFTPFAE